MAKDPLLPLKLLVYGMGIFLVGGFIWLGVKISMKAGEMGEKSCAEITLQQPESLDISRPYAISYADDFWILTQNTHFWRFNRCGKLTQSGAITSPNLNTSSN